MKCDSTTNTASVGLPDRITQTLANANCSGNSLGLSTIQLATLIQAGYTETLYSLKQLELDGTVCRNFYPLPFGVAAASKTYWRLN